MEKLRTGLMFLLIFAIWGVWLYTRPKPQPTPPKTPPSVEVGGTGEGTKPTPEHVEKPPDVEPAKFTHPEVATVSRTLQNEALRVEVTNTGASVRRLVLKGYKDAFEHESNGDRKDLALLDEFVTGFRSLALRDAKLPMETVNWEERAATDKEVTYRYTSPDGLQFEKTYSLGPEKHALRMRLDVANLSDGPLARGFDVIGCAGINQEASGGIYPTPVLGLWRKEGTYSIEEASSGSGCGAKAPLKELGNKPIDRDGENLAWVAAVNKYFACALIPKDRAVTGKYKAWAVDFPQEMERRLAAAKISASDPKAKDLLDWTTKTVATAVEFKQKTWKQGEKTSSEFVMYAGPKEDGALEEGQFHDQRLGDLLDFGWFGFISRFLLLILGGLHWVLRNWGLAVIALVLIVRLCIFPISKRAQVSMFKMQKLQPQLKALQERFKSDPAKQNAETMKFFKEQGVNPVGGCLPLFLQLPIFLGLYNALLKDIHLRQQPFFGWINDLSQPDHLLNLPFNVPLHGTPSFNLLPLIMMLTWFIQAYMAPRSPDPQMAAQQKMFMIMPLVIGYMMYMSPSGLVLYWMVSTVWGIAEQQFIKRVYLK